MPNIESIAVEYIELSLVFDENVLIVDEGREIRFLLIWFL